jgi:hypothetical protein
VDYAAVIAPFAEAFDDDELCGNPAIEFHQSASGYKVWLCASHWDQYVLESNQK